jgi:hypothetical protein
MRRALFVLALVSAACSRAPEHPYPKEVVDNFVASCRARAPEDACRCAIDTLQRRFTLEQFQGYERQMRESGTLPKEMGDAVNDCVPR